MPNIILASQSPRRKQLLEWAEIPFTVVVKHIAEDFPEGLKPHEVAVFVAKHKADNVNDYLDEAYHQHYSTNIIVAADTIVVLGDTIIGKPDDRDHAIQILTSLSGKTHKVITGVVIKTNNSDVTFYEETLVEFHPLTQQQIEYYIDKYEPYDKAGAYAIQEWIGIIGIKKIEGDFYNVMGLPISRLVYELNKLEENSEVV